MTDPSDSPDCQWRGAAQCDWCDCHTGFNKIKFCPSQNLNDEACITLDVQAQEPFLPRENYHRAPTQVTFQTRLTFPGISTNQIYWQCDTGDGNLTEASRTKFQDTKDHFEMQIRTFDKPSCWGGSGYTARMYWQDPWCKTCLIAAKSRLNNVKQATLLADR